MRVLAPLAAQAFVTAAAVDAAAQELGLRRAQCYRLLRRLRADPTVTALLPRQSGRVTNTRFLAGDVEAVIGSAIEEFYLARSRPSVADLVREIGRRCLGANSGHQATRPWPLGYDCTTSGRWFAVGMVPHTHATGWGGLSGG